MIGVYFIVYVGCVFCDCGRFVFYLKRYREFVECNG